MNTPTSSQTSANRLRLGTIFFTVFLDLVGVGIANPIIAPLLLRPESGMLPADYSENERTLLLGVLIAVFSIAGFFSGPLLGALSDRYGRKKVLLASLGLTFTGYLIFALGIYLKNVPLLFLSRTIYGIGGGNLSVIQSAIADVSDERSRTKNFGLIGVAFGLGFIIGPALGGELANPNTVSWFNFTTPFLAAALLSLINIGLVVLNFRETLQHPVDRPVTILTGIRNLSEAFTDSRLRILFLGVFFYALGFNFYTQFFQVILIKVFDYNQTQIGRYFAYVGLWVALMQGTVVRRVANSYAPQQILRFSVLGLGFALWLFLLPQESWQLFLVVPILALFQGLTSPNSTALVSQSAGAQEQGRTLGINQSVLSSAFALPPILAAYMDTINVHLPIVVAGSMVLIGWGFFIRFFRTAVVTN
ncbi:Tetracycline resistance protein, class E Short=TetA(E) [Fibrisoma limi BUZ 3]|uniref:Tetracycline resistance protein, class E Short=TetA(E) n=1 Tax=Fibrisoma limi BUZ 3 TaxID=1185876 RepID=I2GD55_9BACT|nr:MFS transporter [Fibrisoma limi]CCH51829.1 Tetracycline resistance protein, class E Short=TetA(E) [Fibrisoma limi BUZ 3]